MCGKMSLHHCEPQNNISLIILFVMLVFKNHAERCSLIILWTTGGINDKSFSINHQKINKQWVCQQVFFHMPVRQKGLSVIAPDIYTKWEKNQCVITDGSFAGANALSRLN